ncbi:MAG TPA: M23 family metallopeptidase [Thermoanaerobaculia bacterium]|jgi:murein DD-endopeptidase MepM/ murein hydrolase activator NlpD
MKLGRLRGPVVAPAVPPPGESWSLEVQIHPSDIRKRVRYLFLSRVQVTVWSLLALLYLLGLALAAAVAPGVAGGFLNRREYQTLTAERAGQGQRLQRLVDQAGRLDGRVAELDLRLAKVSLVYGLPPVRLPSKPAARAAEPAPKSIYTGMIEQAKRLRTGMRNRLIALEASLREVRAFESAHPDQVRTTPAVCPLHSEFVLVSSFGNRRSPFTRELEFHPGADLAAPLETPVYATADGVVAFAGQYPLARSSAWWRYGNLVIVANGKEFFTVFGHNSRIVVRAGQPVKRGELLAMVGNSGWSTSPHLHYEVRRKGPDGVYRPVDPLIYILDQRWPNEERLLVRARNAPPVRDFEPLPPGTGGRSRRGRRSR